MNLITNKLFIYQNNLILFLLPTNIFKKFVYSNIYFTQSIVAKIITVYTQFTLINHLVFKNNYEHMKFLFLNKIEEQLF